MGAIGQSGVNDVTPPLRENVTGNLTGNVSGNVTGNVTGNVNGNLTGNVSGHLGDPVNVTPVNAVLATGGQLAYQNGTNPTATKKVTIPDGAGNNVVYTFVALVAAAGDVLVGASADATMLNLTRCINKSGGTEGAGQDYMAANGAAHPLVSAAQDAGADTVAFTVKTKGAIGNITITTDEVSITPTSPTGGVDGTVGAKGDVRWDTSYVYVCTAANLASGQNWKRAAISAF